MSPERRTSSSNIELMIECTMLESGLVGDDMVSVKAARYCSICRYCCCKLQRIWPRMSVQRVQFQVISGTPICLQMFLLKEA